MSPDVSDELSVLVASGFLVERRNTKCAVGFPISAVWETPRCYRGGDVTATRRRVSPLTTIAETAGRDIGRRFRVGRSPKSNNSLLRSRPIGFDIEFADFAAQSRRRAILVPWI
jgi:hypothetical protein